MHGIARTDDHHAEATATRREQVEGERLDDHLAVAPSDHR